jgi:hypothetical protein
MNAKVMARAGEEATGLELAKTLVRHDEQKNKRLANKGGCWFVLREKYCWLVAGG